MKASAIREVVSLDPMEVTGAEISVRDDIGLIGHVQVALSAQVGTASMTIERLFGLKAGDIVDMNETLDAPVTILLNGRAVAHGELLAVDDHYGIRILEMA